MAGFEQDSAAPALPAMDGTHDASQTDARPAAAIGPTDVGAMITAARTAGALILCVCESPQMVKREIVPVLLGAGYEVELVEASARRALPPLSSKPYRLLLFDVASRSDIDYQICAQARLASELPILLMLRGAARHEIVRGFQAGADAYVLVPFDPRELLARLEALLRRTFAPSV
jgi:DNA-binding response OmpR family regulator